MKEAGSAKFNYLEVTIYMEGKDGTDIEQRSSKTLTIHNVLRKRNRRARADMMILKIGHCCISCFDKMI